MKTFFAVTLSFLAALILAIIPLPTWAIWFRPDWVLLALIYWSLMLPERVGVNVAFCLGLLMDVLTGTLLGEHALAYVAVAYFTVRFCPLIRLFPIWQQALLIFIFTFLVQAFKFWIWGLSGTGAISVGWIYWLPGIISAILWPVIYTLLKGYQGRYRIYE
ncbi:MAG TPA: rod shape-determining protein MreD [Gammaproteobacteria bacterium]|nr:rod shape-determining protein MreD [Gammaproteobacteria bacterium]